MPEQAPGTPAHIEIAQETAPGSSDFEEHVLGTIVPFSSTASAVDFYRYHSVIPTAYGATEPAARPNGSILFFLAAADGLSIIVVHDGGPPWSGGTARMDVSVVLDQARLLLADDPTGGDPRDRYRLLVGAGTRLTTEQHWEMADGFILGTLDQNWSLLVQFTERPTGLTSWQALSANDNAIMLAPDAGRRIRLRPLPLEHVSSR